MKPVIVLIILIIITSSARADDKPILDFQHIKLSEYFTILYRDVVKKPYIFDTDFIADNTDITVNLNDIKPDKIEESANTILKLHGYISIKSDGVTRIIKLTEKNQISGDVYTYTPLHRSASYLMPMLTPFFPDIQFSTQRAKAQESTKQLGSTGDTPPQILEQGANAQLDKLSELIIYKATLKDNDNLLKLLSKLDTSEHQVIVKAIVMEVRKQSGDASGLDLTANLLNSKFGIKQTQGSASQAGQVFSKLSMLGIDLNLIYSAIKSDDRFNLLTSPRLLVKSGATAKFSVGDETPVLGQSSVDSVGRITTTVNYKPSGTILELSPTIREADIDLNITQQISSFQQTTNGVNGSPTLTKREIKTNVLAHDDETIIIGGLDLNQDLKSSSGLAFLPKWLHTNSSSNLNTDIVIILNVQKL